MDRKKLTTFEFEEKTYHILAPTQKQLMVIDMEYRIAYSNAIRKGIMTELEAKQKFKENGVWTEKQEEQLREFQVDLVNLELQLEDVKTEEEGKEIAFKILKVRNEMIDLSGHKNHIFSSQTAEGYSNEAKRATLAALCTVDENLSPVFNSLDAFSDNNDDSFIATCYAHAILADVGVSMEDVNKPTMEREWLSSHGYLSDPSGELTDKYYQEAITKAAPGIEEFQKEKKKRGRPSKKKK